MSTVYLERLVAAEDELRGPSPEGWYDRLESEESELEAALRAACEQDPDLGLRTAWLLQRFWFARGRLDRGRYWLERLLSAAGDEPTAARAQGLVAAASLAFRQGNNELSKQRAGQSLQVARTLGRTEI